MLPAKTEIFFSGYLIIFFAVNFKITPQSSYTKMMRESARMFLFIHFARNIRSKVAW